MWCGANSDPPSWPHHPSERRGDGVETSSPLEPGNLPGSRLFFGWPGILPGQLLAHSCPIHRSRNDQRPPDLRGSPVSEAFEGPRFPHGPVHLATEQHQPGEATQHSGTLPSREQRGAASVLRPASPPAEDRIASAPLVAAAAGSLERRQAQGPTLGRPAVQTVQEFLMDSAEPSIAENHHDVTAFRVAHHMRNNRVHVG